MILRTEGLTKDFGQLRAIDSLDFELPEREIRAVIGPNGAGKTTFFDLVTGQLRPTAGRIYLHGEDITDWRPHRIARSIGRKFQVTNIYEDFTVLENLQLADQAEGNTVRTSLEVYETSSALDSVLETIGLEGKADDVASTLAYGERQWLEIGMVLLNDPDLLLLDEPTSGMTSEETQRTAGLIEDMAEQKPILIVEHDMEFIYDIADTITVLHQGSKLAEGGVEEISQNETVREVYIGGEL